MSIYYVKDERMSFTGVVTEISSTGYVHLANSSKMIAASFFDRSDRFNVGDTITLRAKFEYNPLVGEFRSKFGIPCDEISLWKHSIVYPKIESHKLKQTFLEEKPPITPEPEYIKNLRGTFWKNIESGSIIELVDFNQDNKRRWRCKIEYKFLSRKSRSFKDRSISTIFADYVETKFPEK